LYSPVLQLDQKTMKIRAFIPFVGINTRKVN